ncbi:unnamed protein product [Dimorphilus gyrociliatus]|uniref:Uncharacterized protein n=1 Tax=Dimorphilus gyrociliatus TaxID=2664684 RepID=A0A7I8WED4_9ANNE|nr:unnamed protein product [Dimorphilus gyrociliatus]
MTLMDDGQYSDPLSYSKDIVYENLSEEGVNQFLKTISTCTQDITFWSFYSFIFHHAYIFWDNIYRLGNNFPDGICKCFTDIRCKEESNVNAECYGTPDNKWVDFSGTFSVKSHSLPLKTIVLGDLGLTVEKVEYSIKKLECMFQLVMVSIEFPFEKCWCNQEKWKKIKLELVDSKTATCVTLIGKILHLTIETLTNFVEFQIYGENIEENNPEFFAYDKNSVLCKEKENYKFFCPST